MLPTPYTSEIFSSALIDPTAAVSSTKTETSNAQATQLSHSVITRLIPPENNEDNNNSFTCSLSHTHTDTDTVTEDADSKHTGYAFIPETVSSGFNATTESIDTTTVSPTIDCEN